MSLKERSADSQYPLGISEALNRGIIELPWGAEGSGQATQAALEPISQLSDPELLRLDRTGQFQQTGRLLNAGDSALAERFGVRPRQDLMTLRDIVMEGGLSGLLNRVKTEGYKGLPAVAGGGIALEQDDEKLWTC